MNLPDYFNVDFEGTASRRTFWLNQLACIVVITACLLGLIVGVVSKSGLAMALFGALTLVAIVFATVSGFAVGARRCRDLGHSGWMVLVYLVPLAWLPFALYLGLAQSRSGRAT